MTSGRRVPASQELPGTARPLRLSMLVCELSMGGAAKVVRDQASAFAEFAESAEVVFNRDDGIDFAGQDVISLDVEGAGHFVGKLAALRQRVTRYAAVKRRLAADISISHLEGAHIVDLLARGDARRILLVHGSIDGNRDIRGLSGWLRRLVIIPWLYRRADAIVTVSRDIEAELRRKGLRKVRTINNFFDTDAIDARSREPLDTTEAALFAGRQSLISVGRLADQKNQVALLDMVAALRTEHPVSLFVIGDGPLRNILLSKAAALGLDHWDVWSGDALRPGCDVYFLGIRPNPFPWIRAADLFVFPSRWEGFPLALCEAMACGTAVVSADCPTGPREILSPDSDIPAAPITAPESAPFGMLMPLLEPGAHRVGALDQWVEAIANLLDDRERRQQWGSTARRRIQDFSREAIVPQWRALFGELGGARNSAS